MKSYLGSGFLIIYSYQFYFSKNFLYLYLTFKKKKNFNKKGCNFLILKKIFYLTLLFIKKI